MIQSLTDLEEATAFERMTVRTIFPAPIRMPGRPSLDLRTNAIYLYAESARSADDGRAETIKQLRPLVFAAAWKILDVVVELALHQDGLSPSHKEWRITEKVTHARKAAGVVVPLSSRRDLWWRVAQLYAETEEARNCLIHRKFVMSAGGDITSLADRGGNLKADVSASDQEAFCRVAEAVASSAIAKRFTPRDERDLSWWLDQLTRHHGQPPLAKGGGRVRSIESVAVNATSTAQGWVLNLADTKKKAASSFQDRPYVDVEIFFPGAAFAPLRGRLEEAPDDPTFLLDPSAPPSWVDP